MRWYRTVVYVLVWLAVLIPAEIRSWRGERVPAWLKVLIVVSGLMLTTVIAETWRH